MGARQRLVNEGSGRTRNNNNNNKTTYASKIFIEISLHFSIGSTRLLARHFMIKTLRFLNSADCCCCKSCLRIFSRAFFLLDRSEVGSVRIFISLDKFAVVGGCWIAVVIMNVVGQTSSFISFERHQHPSRLASFWRNQDSSCALG